MTYLNMGKLFPPWYLACSTLLLLLAGCEGCDNEPDTISFDNMSSHEIGLLIDGSSELGNFTDLTLIIPPSSPYEFSTDFLARADDQEEIAAFTKGRPPFIRNPTSFREGLNISYIPFEDEIVVDATVWILDVDAVNTMRNRENEIIDALAYANDIWYNERMGVRIGDIRCVDKTNHPDAKDLRDFDSYNYGSWDTFINAVGFDSGNINIYLIRKVDNSRRYGVAKSPGESFALGMYAGSVDLPMHETGHNLQLDHTSGSDFNSKDIMKHAGSQFTRRKYITEGQTFRAHTTPLSMINLLEKRPGAYLVDCEHDDNSVTCPRIEKRIWDDGNAKRAN